MAERREAIWPIKKLNWYEDVNVINASESITVTSRGIALRTFQKDIKNMSVYKDCYQQVSLVVILQLVDSSVRTNWFQGLMANNLTHTLSSTLLLALLEAMHKNHEVWLHWEDGPAHCVVRSASQMKSNKKCPLNHSP